MRNRQTIRWVPPHLLLLIRVYALGVLVFAAFRLLTLALHADRLTGLPRPMATLGRSFLIGWRFDTAVSGYLLALPFLMLTVLMFSGRMTPRATRIVRTLLVVSYVISFFLCCVDIPYFSHYNSRLTTGLFSWMDTPLFMLRLVFSDAAYWIFLIPFIFTSWLFWRFVRREFDRFLTPPLPQRATAPLRVALFSLIGVLVLFVAIRGRLDEKSPIRPGTAYFSNNTFVNLLALNPVFTFARGMLNRWHESYDPPGMSDYRAFSLVRQYLDIPRETDYRSPIARRVLPAGKPRKRNVVLIIMESMAAWKTGRYGHRDDLTPNLDSLMEESYVFDRIYTSGVHTYAGVFSTLYGFPVYKDVHPLNQVPIRRYWGLPNVLGSHGYRTLFFLTHDDQFDNLGGFLRANGVDRIICKRDYPAREVRSTLGVPDHVMFDRAINELDRCHREQRPFLAVLLTASDHRPFIIPDNIPFKPDPLPRRLQIVQYADWAIGEFVNAIRQRPWYRSSLVVLVADSGALRDGLYDLPLSMHHTPLVIHAEGITDPPRSFPAVGGQIDVFPTVMGLLNLPFVNNTLGIDLLSRPRHWIFFSNDDKLGCLGRKWYLVVRDDQDRSLYYHDTRDTRDMAQRMPRWVRRMSNYMNAMFIVARRMAEQQKAGYPARLIDSGDSATMGSQNSLRE